MRPFDLRSRPLLVSAGALVVTTSLTAVAPAAPQPEPAGTPVPMTLRATHLSYGERLTATGRLPASDSGRRVSLRLRGSDGRWTVLATGLVAGDGGYVLSGVPRSSGVVSVARVADARTAVAAAVRAAGPPPQPVRVDARISTRARVIDVLSGRRASLHGRVEPSVRGRRVALQARHAGHWRTVDRASTGRGGRFAFGFRAARLGSLRLRVRFGGDGVNGRATRRAGLLRVYRASTASWYQLSGGALACGGRMTDSTMGVANRSLPCGTRVTIRYRGRAVRVPVLDRGPFVGGRDWDLSGAVARTLHFGGVGTVWTTS